MLKTIKTTKKMRLDELIKHVWDNDIKTDMVFRSNEGVSIRFVDDGRTITSWVVGKEDTFTVEIEEPITEDTVFNTLVDVNNNGEVHVAWNDSIDLYDKEQTKEIHAVINGKLELIWEADTDEL